MRFKEYRLSLTIIAVLIIVGFSPVQTYAAEAVPGSGVTTIMQSWGNRYYPNYPQPGTPLRMQGESPAYEAEADNMEELAAVLGAAFVQRETSKRGGD